MMRKLATLMLVFLMAVSSVALAQEMDLSAMDEAELRSLIDAARMELTRFYPAVAEGSVLYEDENVKITLTGDPYLEYGSLRLPVVVENFTQRNIIISFDNASCNGWEISDGITSVSAGKKAKDTLDFYDVENMADLSDVSLLQDITCTVSYFDEDDYDWDKDDNEPSIWQFNISQAE